MKDFILNWIGTKRYEWRKYDYTLIIVVLFLISISVYSLSLIKTQGFASSEVKHQIMGIVLGLMLLFACSIIDYHLLCVWAPILYIIATLMVAATRFSPIGTQLGTGSYRWLNLKFFNFQPSEICKIVLILTLAVFFQKMQEHLQSFKTFFIACGITLLPVGFIMVQSNLSSALVYLSILVLMILGSGIGYKIIAPVVGVTIPVLGAFLWYLLQPGEKILLNAYQVKRIVGFFNQESEQLGTMFQQNNSIVSIASGKLYGKLLLEGPSNVRNYGKVDVTESDFIWSVLGEEYGFIGCIFVLALIAFVIVKCFLIASRARDYEGMMIAIGIAAMFSFQTFVHVGVTTSILPNTGLPLPFLSSGLSSMMSSMIAVGIMINIGMQPARAGTGSITSEAPQMLHFSNKI